ncbi:hypothetical protein CARUB_v10027614mg, partial [Capsella rubella]
TAEVFDSSQDNLMIQIRVNRNRRILIDTPLPGKDPALNASPPSPDFSTFKEPLLPPPSPEGNKTPSPPQSGVPAQTPETPPDITPLPVPPAPPTSQSHSPLPGTKKKSTKVYMIVGIVAGVFIISGILIIFFLIFTRKIPIKPWTNSGQLQDALLTGKQTLQSSLSLSSLFMLSFSNFVMHKLSKVDHKNFLNVIGYCHEEEPFSRMLVFEYAPNGCLSEHLHSLSSPRRLLYVGSSRNKLAPALDAHECV